MSFDLFVGKPNNRIIRKKELLDFYNHEMNQGHLIEVSLQNIPHAIIAFSSQLAHDWPPLNPTGHLDNTADIDDEHSCDYNFNLNSLNMCFAWSQADEAYKSVKKLASQYELLFFNCSGTDWLNAYSQSHDKRSGSLFLSEEDKLGSGNQKWQGGTTWIEKNDIDLLTDTTFFKPKTFFGFEFGDEEYMQTLNEGDHYAIEYRKGSSDKHFRACDVINRFHSSIFQIVL